MVSVYAKKLNLVNPQSFTDRPAPPASGPALSQPHSKSTAHIVSR